MKSTSFFLTLSLLSTAAFAQDGQIDYEFGDFIGRSVLATNDPQSTTHSDNAIRPLRHAGGKVHVFGSSQFTDQRRITTFRLNLNGTSDNTFGGGSGYQRVFLAGVNYQPFLVDAVTQPVGGNIVSVGNTQRSVGNLNDRNDIAVCRYFASGDFDVTFAGGVGCKLVDINPGLDTEEYADAVAIDNFGRIVVLGHTHGFEYFVARLTTTGAYDIEFNGGLGIQMINLPELDQQHYEAIKVDLDGFIMVGGHGNFPNNERYHAVVMRLDDGGTLDADFSGDGRVAIPVSVANDPLPRSVSIEDIAVDSSSRIALVGRATLPDLDNPDQRAAFIRLTSEGVLDTSFNGSGYRLDRGPQDQESQAKQLRFDSFGRWVVGGSSRPIVVGSTTNTMVWRLMPNGVLDTRFDGDGRVYLDNAITYGSDDASDDFAGLLVDNNSIVVTMNSEPDTSTDGNDIITMRLHASELFVDSFE